MPSNKSPLGRLPVALAALTLLAVAGGCASPSAGSAPTVAAQVAANTPVPAPAPAPAAPLEQPVVTQLAPAPAASLSPVAAATSASVVAAKSAPLPRTRPAPDLLAQQMFDDALRALRAGKTAEAEQSLGVIARTHPELGGAYANLGLIQRQAGHLPQALESFDKAILANPDQAVYHQQRGLTLKEMGRFADARAAYERALELNPQYALAALNLGVLLDLYMGDAPGAVTQFQRYLELTPGGDPAVTKWLAELKNRKPEPTLPKEPS